MRGIVAMLVALGCAVAAAQQPATAVEVASIRPTADGIITGQGAARVGWETGSLFRINDGSVSVLLYSAYPASPLPVLVVERIERPTPN
jgi:hypothetical protein